MKSLISVHPHFDGVWPFAADRARELWSKQREVLFFRRKKDDTRPWGKCFDPAELKQVGRALIFDKSFEPSDLTLLPGLKEVGFNHDHSRREEFTKTFQERGVAVRAHRGEGFWGQSVSEFALALTLSALRRIPQTHMEMKSNPAVWEYDPKDKNGLPGMRGQQFGDDLRFTCGTLGGKKVRVVGLGNIGSRYAQWASQMGADVAGWDPVAQDPSFHRSGTRRVEHLEELFHDAEIVVPMMPLVPKTQGLVTAAMIKSIPKGALVVLVTRAGIVDMPTLRGRVLNGELALAADVFDIEPVPFDDPLLKLPHVIHTPHNAGRTRDANFEYAESLLAQFSEIPKD
ncbi:MAG: hydroxyacid dehydrogenase [Spirochaetia bacterium]|nr:hydroxyacid dehydrogenase [Spirochaetia bacterium]